MTNDHVAHKVDSSSLPLARKIATAAAHHDGSEPVSDQAFLALEAGERQLMFEGTDAFGIFGQGEVDLVVHPEARGRGIGTELLDRMLAQAGESLRAWAHGENPAAEALLRKRGFTPVRTLYRMSLDPALLPERNASWLEDLEPQLPETLTLRALHDGDPADAAAWVRVNAAAFYDHPEQGRITLADFARMCEEPWFDANDVWVLEVRSALQENRSERPTEFAGSTWIKTTSIDGRVHTELYAVGVDPQWAGRGLGRILLQATLARMAQHHPHEVSLYVDGENSRAVELYERAGFVISKRSRQWSNEPAKMES